MLIRAPPQASLSSQNRHYVQAFSLAHQWSNPFLRHHIASFLVCPASNPIYPYSSDNSRLWWFTHRRHGHAHANWKTHLIRLTVDSIYHDRRYAFSLLRTPTGHLTGTATASVMLQQSSSTLRHTMTTGCHAALALRLASLSPAVCARLVWQQGDSAATELIRAIEP